MRKSTVVILNQLNIKNNKDNFEKNHNKKKNLVGEHYSNPYYFKGKNYEAKFSTSSIWKKNKIKKDNSGKKIIKKGKKHHVGKHCSNSKCFKEEKLQS